MSERVFARWRRIWAADSWVKPFFSTYRKALLASLGLGILAMIFAAGLMAVSGYLISAAAERPEHGVFDLFVPLAIVQIFGLGKPFLSYQERLKSHDWVLHMTSQLRLKVYRSLDKDDGFWSRMRKAGDTLGLLAMDMDYLQDLYLRVVFPSIVAWVIWLLLSLLLGFFSLPFALFMLLGSFVLVFVMPLVAVLVNSARQLRAKQLASQAYDTALDDISGLADWTFSQRHDDFMQRNLAPMREIDACNAAIAASNRRRDFVGQLIFLLLAAAVLFWAAAHFGQMPQAAAPSGDLSRPSDWIAAFVLGFFPLLDAFAPLPAAAIQTNAYLDSVERMNALPQVDGGDRGASPLGAGALARISLEPLPLRGTAAATTCEDTAGTSPERDSLCVEHASFAYAGGDPVLQDVSIDFAPGSRTAILGPSGAGKSTLLRLLRGDYSPTAGSVTLDGVPTSQLGDATPRHIAVMQQHNHLFNQSLLANLRLGKPDATEQEATAALEAAGLGALIPKLPAGLKTVLGEEGTNFSGGEGQRIALARILLQDTPVVILDEPFASLDPSTERELLDTVLRVLAGKTIIMVTHHLMGIEQMDQVIFLDNGRITMQGAPDQLATSNAQFRELLSLDRGLLL